MLGARVRELRGGMSQEELGRRAGVSWKTVARIEKGNGANSTTIVKLARALGVPIDDLFEQQSA